MKNIIAISSLLLFIACKSEAAKEVVLNNELDSVSYSLGVNIGENMQSQFEDINIDNFLIGMKEVINDKTEPKINGEQALMIIQNYLLKNKVL